MGALEQIKNLRERTGAGVVDVKKALDDAGGDEEKAIEILRKKGQDKAVKKSSRVAREGIIATYLHTNRKISVMVKLFCETDFVARNEEFQELGKDIAMHIAAMSPTCIRPEEVPADAVSREREIWSEQLKAGGKPEAMMEKIMSGKEDKFRREQALMTQSFVKNPEMTVEQLVAEKVGKIGENIQVGEFVRFEI